MAILESIKKLKEKHDGPSSARMRKLGNQISLLGTTVQVTVAGMQVGGDVMSARQYFWFVISLAIAQWLGRVITDLSTNDDVIKVSIEPAAPHDNA